MNRRAAIGWALGAAVAGVAILREIKRRPLPPALADLYDERFVEALPRTSLEAIATRLVDRGVLVVAAKGDGNSKPNMLPSSPVAAEQHRWSFDIDRVRANAAGDALVEFDHSLYTETELLLYSLVARSRHEGSLWQQFRYAFD